MESCCDHKYYLFAKKRRLCFTFCSDNGFSRLGAGHMKNEKKLRLTETVKGAG